MRTASAAIGALASNAAACDGLAVYLADMEGEASYDAADWSNRWALIIGSEAHGASKAAVDLAHQRIYIPMAAATESLNAASAAAIITLPVPSTVEPARPPRNIAPPTRRFASAST